MQNPHSEPRVATPWDHFATKATATGYHLALTASGLFVAQAILILCVLVSVAANEGFSTQNLKRLLGTTPLPFALYAIWALGVAGTAASVVAVAVYNFKERWFWRAMVLAACMWLLFPPLGMAAGIVALVVLIKYRAAFPVVPK
jgi:hypothetical protein